MNVSQLEKCIEYSDEHIKRHVNKGEIRMAIDHVRQRRQFIKQLEKEKKINNPEYDKNHD